MKKYIFLITTLLFSLLSCKQFDGGDRATGTFQQDTSVVILYDTIRDTVSIKDTLLHTTYDTVTVIDTVKESVTLFDTLVVVDTERVEVKDTITISDTIFATQIDTVIRYDTIPVQVIDTIVTTVELIDTIRDTIFISPTDTTTDTIISPQTGSNDTTTVDLLSYKDDIDIESLPIKESVSLKELIGVNGGLLLGGNIDKFSKIQNHRIFYLMEHDVKGEDGRLRLPKDFVPKPCMAKCPNIDCDWQNTNAAWKYRICEYNKHFKNNSISLEVIMSSDGKGARPYPDKFWYEYELPDPYEYGYKYGKMLAESLDGMVTSIEVGNELHGQPYKKSYQWAKGVAQAIKDSGKDIEVVSPDLSGFVEKLQWNGQKINTYIYDWQEVLPLFDAIQMHEYGFDDNFKVTLPPEYFLEPEIISLVMSTRKPIVIGEFGFDSEQLGEHKQAQYIMRAFLIAQRYGVRRAYVYSAVDDGPWAQPFQYTGLVYRDGKEKESYREVMKLIDKYGDFRFKKDLSNGNEYKYVLSDGNKELVVSWNVKEDSDIKFELR